MGIGMVLLLQVLTQEPYLFSLDLKEPTVSKCPNWILDRY